MEHVKVVILFSAVAASPWCPSCPECPHWWGTAASSCGTEDVSHSSSQDQWDSRILLNCPAWRAVLPAGYGSVWSSPPLCRHTENVRVQIHRVKAVIIWLTASSTWRRWRRSCAHCVFAPRTHHLWEHAWACVQPEHGTDWSGTTWNAVVLEQISQLSFQLQIVTVYSLSALVCVWLRYRVAQPHLKLVAAQRCVSVVADEAVEAVKDQVVSQVEAGGARLLTWMDPTVLDSTWAPGKGQRGLKTQDRHDSLKPAKCKIPAWLEAFSVFSHLILSLILKCN